MRPEETSRFSNLSDEIVEAILEGLENLQDPFAVYDVDDILVHCNNAYRDSFAGLEPPNLIGMSFEQIATYSLGAGVYPNALGVEESYLKNRIEKHKMNFANHEQTLPNGKVERITEIALSSGYKIGLHSIITELTNARGKAEAENEATAQFLANLSHEIRTPLVGIIGLMDILLEKSPRSDQIFEMNTIQSSGETLLRILNDVLDISKIRAGRLELLCVEFDPVNLSGRILDRYKLRASLKGVNLTLNVLPNVTSVKLGDDLRLGQMLDNLLSNALKFTEKGEVVLTINSVAGSPLVICIQDTGIGMNAEQIEKVMSRYSQADVRIAQKYGGTGLGIPIVKHFCDLMDGAICFESNVGAGTKVTLTLPLLDASSPPENKPKFPSKTSTNFKSSRALIADDGEINRLLLSAFLERLGVDAVLVADGDEAVEFACQQKFDFIFLDISMPKLDGYGALTQIRSHLGSNCPLMIAVTAHALKHEISAITAAGFDGCLTKPFYSHDLVSLLESLANRKVE